MGKSPERRTRAFTLVELLVVISVIMVLVGLVLPVLLRAAGRARVAQCISNLGQLAKAIVSYQGTFEGFLPSPAHVDTKGGDPTALDDSILNDDTLFDGDREEEEGEYVYHSYTWRGKLLPFVGARGKDEESLYGIYRCPSVRNFKGHKSFYGFNAFMGMHPGEVLRDSSGEMKVTHMDDILDTGRTFLFGENNARATGSSSRDSRPQTALSPRSAGTTWTTRARPTRARSTPATPPAPTGCSVTDTPKA